MTQINLGQEIQIYKLKFKDRTKPTFEIKESPRNPNPRNESRTRQGVKKGSIDGEVK